MFRYLEVAFIVYWATHREAPLRGGGYKHTRGRVSEIFRNWNELRILKDEVGELGAEWFDGAFVVGMSAVGKEDQVEVAGGIADEGGAGVAAVAEGLV